MRIQNCQNPDHADALRNILCRSRLIQTALDGAEVLQAPQWHLGGGCVAQTVWNYLARHPLDADITDIDLVYFEPQDLSEQTEGRYIHRAEEVSVDLAIPVDLKNQARVHLWYERRFGRRIRPYRSIEDAISHWPTTATCVGVTRCAGQIEVCAPYGLADLFAMVVRPNKSQVSEDVYLRKTSRWKQCWPQLQIIPW